MYKSQIYEKSNIEDFDLIENDNFYFHCQSCLQMKIIFLRNLTCNCYVCTECHRHQICNCNALRLDSNPLQYIHLEDNKIDIQNNYIQIKIIKDLQYEPYYFNIENWSFNVFKQIQNNVLSESLWFYISPYEDKNLF